MGKPDPWRAGANENTIFSASDEILIGRESRWRPDIMACT